MPLVIEPYDAKQFSYERGGVEQGSSQVPPNWERAWIPYCSKIACR